MFPTTASDRLAADAAEFEPLTLPAAWVPSPRPPVPVVASVVPVIGAVALWLVTGSILSLWLAALGPLIAVATVADAARAGRRDRRRARADAARARADVSAAVASRHETERRRCWARHPDVAAFVDSPEAVWRGDLDDAVVVGAGEVSSAVRVSGGEGDPDAAALRARASRLTGAPVVVPARDGIAVVGPPALASAVARGLVLKLAMALPPGELRLLDPVTAPHAWAAGLPHARATSGGVLALAGPGEAVPLEADHVIAVCAPSDPRPPRCGAVLTVHSPGRARLARGSHETAVQVEGLSADQAEMLARQLTARAERALGWGGDAVEAVTLASLTRAVPPAEPGSLPAVLGLEGSSAAIVDLVVDGPHAVVTGVTGSGKSELLITWILSLCARHSTDEVTFLLADFKGGTAFDALSGVPHVTGVITDLDGAGARRAIESLRAEIRWRESTIASSGARDILDARVQMPRLVVVVDEFAALLGEHPELQSVFADVAARGRALGIHLILGTQRASGVVRESLLANCPLRVSLRVTDRADSRFVLGTEDAAHLPGGPSGRGRAFIRRAADAAPRAARIALSSAEDVERASRASAGPPPRRPWLPALPAALTLDELRTLPVDSGVLGFGLADEPERQRQRVTGVRIVDRGLLVIGGPGSGATNVLDALAAQAPADVLRVPSDPESLWDAVAAMSESPPRRGTLVLIDDLDTLPLRLAPDHAQAVFERLEELLRRAGDAGILIVGTAHRVTGAVSRLADLFPRRLLLPLATRADHLAAGGDGAAFDPAAPPGRGRLDGTLVQVARAASAGSVPSRAPTPWAPRARLTGLATRRSPAARAAVAAWRGTGARVATLDEYAADPSIGAQARVVLVGEPDDWQRHWRLLADVRGDHDLVVDSSCAAELRLLTGSRAIPPYCEPGRGRAWLVSGGEEPVRIILPSEGDQ